ncbi:MAG: F0F1 ATP synthase subunit B [Chitinispirillaceae bacterium]|nr:F0F1 ATP synthase subunit B [Chitinispirillaceae bacterium]
MLEIQWWILASQAITFLIALAVVWKLAWKPLVQFIRDRQDRVKKTLDDAENAKAAIAKLEAEYREKLQGIERKSAELIAAARNEAGRAKDDIVRAAQEETLALRKKTQEQLEQERRRVMAEMRSEIVGLSMAIAEKALAGPLPDKVQERKFKELLDEIEGARKPS